MVAPAKEDLKAIAAQAVLEWYLETGTEASLYDVHAYVNRGRHADNITAEALLALSARTDPLSRPRLMFPDCDGELVVPIGYLGAAFPTWTPTKEALRDHILELLLKLESR